MADDFVTMVNAMPGGWVKAMGIVVTRADADEVACEWTVEDKHADNPRRQSSRLCHG